MDHSRNPFEYEAANDLPLDAIVDWYIDDFNYARFIRSRRNILLTGARGCGKSMTLLYNSWPLQSLVAAGAGHQPATDYVGVYVPCNTPLIHKPEHQLLPDGMAATLSEHFLVLSLAHSLASTLARIHGAMDGANEESLRSRFEYVFQSELREGVPLFEAVAEYIERESLETQRAVNQLRNAEVEYYKTLSFSSLLMPMLGLTRRMPTLATSHVMFLVDDAHDLNPLQLRCLNSWIAYRDRSLFSFKVAMASADRTPLKTSSGGNILEGHDYTRLDMVQPFHNSESAYGQHASRVISTRLRKYGLDTSPEDFFPISPQLKSGLEQAKQEVQKEADAAYPEDSSRRSDYVYRHKRARYFRSRSPKANRPEYSGFEMLTYLSTGVIRNLLQPCYWMFDDEVSKSRDSDRQVSFVEPRVQREFILSRSERLWTWLREEMCNSIEGCSPSDQTMCYQLLDKLADLFRKRLLTHKSEPRANSFTISGKDEPVMSQLAGVILLLEDAQLLYKRSGPAKERGSRELYYVPNRMLWPIRGLDPHGQNARVSLQAQDLWLAASENREIPYSDPTDVAESPGAHPLFDQLEES